MLPSFAAHLAAREHSPRTTKAYTEHLALFARWFEQTNGQPLTKTNLTNIDAREWRQYMISQKHSPATINARLAALKAFGNWCDIPLSVRSVKQQALAPRWLKKPEQARLLREAERATRAATGEAATRVAERTYNIVRLLLNTGLRIGELVGVQPGDVHATERGGAITIPADIAKGGKARAVMLNKEARDALAALPLPLGLSVRAVQTSIAELARAAGVACSPHTFRHTFLHNLIAAGVPEAQAQALAGHGDVRSTRRYTTPSETELQRAVEVLE